jgi:mannosylglycerate hydrolase
MHLKQANHAGEVLLEKYVEPLTALAWLSGADVPQGTPDLLWLAWHWLLLNHPHDDIYGSGIDEVHHEMDFRFSQSRQIGEVLTRDSLRQIARQVDYTKQEGTPIIVFNPLGWAREEIVEAEIDFEFDDPKAKNFQLVNAAGDVLPHQVLSSEELFWMEVFKPNRKQRVKVLFPVKGPAFGYTTVYAQPVTGETKSQPDLTVFERGAENRYLSFTISDDGSLIVTDKTSGQTYNNLHQFNDVEDAGDEYTYCPCENSQTVSTAGGQAVITQMENGPCRITFRVEQRLDIPEGLAEDDKSRSLTTIPMRIVSYIRLYADQPGLHITTEIENRARDHKLTVNFPTGLRPKQAHVDESFMIAARDLKLPSSEGWVEDPTSLMHQRAFTDLSDGGRGLAVLNRGLPSVEVSEDGVIALTLLRCVGWLSRPWLSVRRIAAGPLVPTPGAQCIGSYRYEYAILPHSGDWQQVYKTAYGYNAPMLARRADTHPGLELREMNITRDNPNLVTPIAWPRGGVLADTFSFIQINPPELVLSAVRRGENGVIVRFYNVTREPVEGTITFGLPLASAYRTNMAEQREETLAVRDGNRVNLNVGGAQVITLELIPAQ